MGMERWVMVPILTEKESEEGFVGQVRGAQRIVLLFVVDQENMDAPAGVVGSKIKRAESTMRELKKKLVDTEFREYVEWGKWLQKIENIAKLEKVDEIVMIHGDLADELAPVLREREIKVRIV
jgi:hypothetical protein